MLNTPDDHQETRRDMIAVDSPLFRPGHVVATPGAMAALERAQVGVWKLLSRHLRGDFGDVDAEDRQANRDAIASGERVFSAYTLPTGERVWIITEADRSSTTLLLPDEY